MTPNSAIEQYVELIKQVFSGKKLFWAVRSSAYKAKNLQEALKLLVRNATGNEDEKMKENKFDTNGCRT